MFSLLRRLRARLKYRHFDRDLAQELEVHHAMKQEDLEARGLSASEARPAATRALGNTTYMREEARSVWIARWMETTWQDLRYAARGMRRQPGFSLAAILILAIGVSSLTVAYSVMNARLLRPWQVPEPASVVIVRARPAPQQQYGTLSIDEAMYLDEHARTVSALTTFIRGGEQVERDGPNVQSSFVTSRYFDVMGVRVMSGPGFTPGSDRNPAAREVVISDRLWKTYFNNDPSIAGRTVQLSSVPFTIVGVAQPGFEDVYSNRLDLWMSLSALNFGGLSRPGGAVVARLHRGVNATQALAELEGLSGQFRSANNIPAFGLLLRDTRPISSEQSTLTQEYIYIFLALALILVLTCANVGSLLLARSLRRRREIAVRLSLGAGRWRVARQFLTETFLLTLCAGAVGVALAYAVPRITVSLSGSTSLRTDYLAPDWTVVAFAVVVSGMAALLAGSSAARGVGRLSLAEAVSQHGPDRRSRRSRGVLLTAQVAITVVFLTSAGLVGRAAVVASAADPGFATDDIHLVRVTFREQLTPARRNTFTREFAQAVEAAGMTNVAFAQSAPLIKGASTSMRVHRPDEHPSTARILSSRSVSPNYFSVMRIPILDGVTPDSASASGQLVVNESFAREFWPGERAVGQTLIQPGSKENVEFTVVAVVRDVPIRSIGTFEPVAYQPTRGLPLLLVPNTTVGALDQLRSMSQAIEPTAVLAPTPMREIVRESFSETASASLVGWMVGAAALLISTLGIFGVFSYAVEERRREIGIRIALGGAARHVSLQVLRSGQRATAIGVAIGFFVCVIAASLLRNQLFGLQPFDVVTYLQVATILSAATMVALWIPARRATRVDPAITLRCE